MLAGFVGGRTKGFMSKTRNKVIGVMSLLLLVIGAGVFLGRRGAQDISKRVDNIVNLRLVSGIGAFATVHAAYMDGENPDARKPQHLLSAFAECALDYDVSAEVTSNCGTETSSELSYDSVRYLVWQPTGVGAGRWTRLMCPGGPEAVKGGQCLTLSEAGQSVSGDHPAFSSGLSGEVKAVPGKLMNPIDKEAKAAPSPVCIQIHYSGNDVFMSIPSRWTPVSASEADTTDVWSSDISKACPRAEYGGMPATTPTPAKSGSDYTDLTISDKPGEAANDSSW